MNLICPNCKFELILYATNRYRCGIPPGKCDLSVFIKLNEYIIVRNYNTIELVLHNYEMPIANLEIIILEDENFIDYKTSENIQEILFDLFKILLKYEENLVFL